MSIRVVDRSQYPIPEPGPPPLHSELEWYATGDDAVLGVVILDLVDRDFGWVVLTRRGRGRCYRGIDLAVSCPTLSDARQALHAAMEAANGRRH